MLSNDNKKKDDEKAEVTIDKGLKEDKENIVKEDNETLDENIANEKNENLDEKNKDGKISFSRRLEAIVIDQIIIGAISYILLLLSDMILRFTVGMFIADMLGIYLIIFIVIGILYPLILGGTKRGNTPGRTAAGLGPINK